jgi:hypothetical protein
MIDLAQTCRLVEQFMAFANETVRQSSTRLKVSDAFCAKPGKDKRDDSRSFRPN